MEEKNEFQRLADQVSDLSEEQLHGLKTAVPVQVKTEFQRLADQVSNLSIEQLQELEKVIVAAKREKDYAYRFANQSTEGENQRKK